MSTYDADNVFAKMLRGEIPCDKVYEDDYALAFNDISPQAPVHVLVIPKVAATSYAEFIQQATSEQLGGFFQAIEKVVSKLELEQGGYRLLVNNGEAARQEVPHLHFHILAGKDLGPMLVQ